MPHRLIHAVRDSWLRVTERGMRAQVLLLLGLIPLLLLGAFWGGLDRLPWWYLDGLLMWAGLILFSFGGYFLGRSRRLFAGRVRAMVVWALCGLLWLLAVLARLGVIGPGKG